jgi:hypothetical protein
MKNGPPKYFKELEERWECNKAARQSGNDETESPPPPKGLRAPVLMAQLMRWSAAWKDPRFEACWVALLEHGIVKGNLETFHFTGRKGPEIEEARQQVQTYRRQIDEIYVSHVRMLIDEDKTPEYRACAIVAAEYGRPANSFKAAIEQLKHLLRKSGKRVRTRKSSHRVPES